MKIIEIREYKIKAGKTDEWLNWMQTELIPYQRSKGMIITDTYIHKSPDGSDYFIWIREFENEIERKAVYELTYNDWWIQEVRPRVFELIDKESISVKLAQKLNL